MCISAATAAVEWNVKEQLTYLILQWSNDIKLQLPGEEGAKKWDFNFLFPKRAFAANQTEFVQTE